MCGLCGFVGEGTRQDLAAMTNTLQHRGPDEQGIYIDEKTRVYFGHQRLSILDVTQGQQPMSTSDKNYTIVYNGEIYNHAELRSELEMQGYQFVTRGSDTETVLLGYRAWGPHVLDRLNGMWAFAIFDRRRQELFLARDRFGQKPLYYSLQSHTFLFASELQTFTAHSKIHLKYSAKSVQKYFAYGFIPSPSSLYDNVYSLPAGHYLTYEIKSRRVRKRKYWEFRIEPSTNRLNEKSAAEELAEKTEIAVQRRLLSDVPIGLFISGGVDSTAIATFATRNSNERLYSFSLGFDDKSFDESPFAQMVADHLGTKHITEKLTSSNIINAARQIALSLDEPMGDSSLPATYMLSLLARQHVKVALGGDGADELFAGYDPFKALTLAYWYKKLVPHGLHIFLRKIIDMLPTSHNNLSLDFRLKRTMRGLSYPNEIINAVWLGPLAPDELKELFHEDIDIGEIYEEAISAWFNCSQTNLFDRTLEFYTKLYLPEYILRKTDRAGMANSLEVRAPFLDIELVEFARQLPYELKYRRGKGKLLLKKALEGIVPDMVLQRKKKGFGVPLGNWFKNGQLSFNNTMLPESNNQKFFQRKLVLHQQGKRDEHMYLWNEWLLRHHSLRLNQENR